MVEKITLYVVSIIAIEYAITTSFLAYKLSEKIEYKHGFILLLYEVQNKIFSEEGEKLKLDDVHAKTLLKKLERVIKFHFVLMIPIFFIVFLFVA